MVESKGWNWNIVQGDSQTIWKEPSVESFYYLNRWKDLGFKDYLDLGCGLGRHTVLFARNGFNTNCFDIEQSAIDSTTKWCSDEGFKVTGKVGDMLNLPYEDESFDCIFCRNVISHTDTEGVKKAIAEIRRVLRKGGECYFTLASKSTFGFSKTDWPLIDKNTKICKTEGPEYNVPHYFADLDDVKELVSDFTLIDVYHVESFWMSFGHGNSSFHYHILVRK